MARTTINAEWIPAAFLLPTFLLAAAVAVIEDACDAAWIAVDTTDEDEEMAA